jgi:hypothetical protein
MLSGDVRISGLGIGPLSYVSLRGSALLRSNGCLSSFLIFPIFAVDVTPACSCNTGNKIVFFEKNVSSEKLGKCSRILS